LESEGFIDNCWFSCYIYSMIITQTIEIPANRRVHLDFEIPVEIPIGKAQISVTPLAEMPGTPLSLVFEGIMQGA
jgi:hypothetical protein